MSEESYMVIMIQNGRSQLRPVDLNASAPYIHETKYLKSNLRSISKLRSMFMYGNSTAG